MRVSPVCQAVVGLKVHVTHVMVTVVTANSVIPAGSGLPRFSPMVHTARGVWVSATASWTTTLWATSTTFVV